MIIIPAIDLQAGKCVRLVQGKMDRATVYSHDPVAVARLWEEIGAEMLHLVDLDGAAAGYPRNLDLVQKIVHRVKIPVQIGGGLRTMKTIEMMLAMGIRRVILGTAAVADTRLVSQACKKFGERIVVGIDSKNGFAAVEGWQTTAGKRDFELAQEMKELGVERVVYTDTGRDGTLRGPNTKAAGKLAQASGLKVIVAGGVASLDDIRKVKDMEPFGVEGVITGKALYAGTLDLKDALKISRGEMI